MGVTTFQDILWSHFHEIVNYEVQAASSADIRITFLHPVQFLPLTDDIHFLPSQVLPAICPQRLIVKIKLHSQNLLSFKQRRVVPAHLIIGSKKDTPHCLVQNPVYLIKYGISMF